MFSSEVTPPKMSEPYIKERQKSVKKKRKKDKQRKMQFEGRKEMELAYTE